MSGWWDLVAEKKKYPFAPLEPSEPATDRTGIAALVYGAALLLFAGSLVAAVFVSGWTVALSLLGASFALMVLFAVVMPRDRKRPSGPR